MEAAIQQCKLNRRGIKFLVATDIHLGHQQNHSERGNDSFNAFQEVLEVADKQKVDFLLLGGDLFDQVNPSQQTIYRCLNKLKSSVFGHKDINIHAQMFGNKNGLIPNFQNENINIKLPIFTIHGNHDYPTNDFGKISICDLLHASSYVNYFGKQPDLSKIKIKPLIITKQKQKVKLAIYGLGYIKDSVLHALFEQGKVQFEKIQDDSDIFNLLILHQNRYKKGEKVGAPFLSCIHSINIPQWMDLTIWGHEHEAIQKIQSQNNRKIIQPGSTVITSFIQAQGLMKQAILINTDKQKRYQVNFIKLQKSFRPMYCNNYQIQLLRSKYGQNIDLYSFLEDQIEGIITQYKQKYPLKKPIIRLKVQMSGHDLIRYKQLQARYSDSVANSQKIFHFWKRKKQVIVQKSDKQFLEAIKSKKPLENPNTQIKGQILAIIEQKIKSTKKIQFYNEQKMFTFASKCVSDETTNTKPITHRYFQKILTDSTSKIQEDLKQFNQTMNKEYNRAVEQRIKNICLNMNGSQSIQQRTTRKNIPILTTNQYKNFQLAKTTQIQSLNLMQAPKDDTGESRQQISLEIQKKNIKIQQNSEDISQQRQIQSLLGINIKSQQLNKKTYQRPSILKKSKQETKNVYIQSEQQDCCSRAARTEYQQKKTQFNFKNAQEMITKNNKKKRNTKKSVSFKEKKQNNE